MPDNKTEMTLLLDIYSRMSVLELQNELILKEQAKASDGRKAIYEAAEVMRTSMANVTKDNAALTKRVDILEPNVTSMAAFKIQVSLAVVFVTAVVTGALNMVWFAVSHFKDIMDAVRSFLR